MRSWTSIPFYLWKNTCNRWIEHPVSPFAKILLPFLLALLGLLVLVLFSQVETQLRDQLAQRDLRTIVVNEVSNPIDAPAMILRSLDEETMWVNLYGREKVTVLRQPLVGATSQQSLGIPILAYSHPLEGLPAEDPLQPGAILLQKNRKAKAPELLNIAKTHFYATPALMPPWLAKQANTTRAVAMPLPIVMPLLRQGFISTTIIELPEASAVRPAEDLLRAYFKSESRNPRIFSAVEILASLQRLAATQALIRTIIFAAIATILALILGNVAMLEYRQDAYLLALLRSFGVSRYQLLAHTLMENLLLVGSGMALAIVAWQPIYLAGSARLAHLGLQKLTAPEVNILDFQILLAAALAGVLLAMLPITLGLRRPIGGLLQ